MHMDILDYFDKIDELATAKKWDELDGLLNDALEQEISATVAEQVKGLDMAGFATKAKAEMDKAITQAEHTHFEAVLYRYDPETDWQGQFFTCPNYEPFQGDEEWWAQEAAPVGEIIVPEGFSDLYNEHGPDEQPESGTYLMLALKARVNAALGKLTDELPPKKFAICTAYEGQEKFTRLRELKKEATGEMPEIVPGDSLAGMGDIAAPSGEIEIPELPPEL
jgi:hypothetical protein